MKINLQLFAGGRGQDLAYLKLVAYSGSPTFGSKLSNVKGDLSIAISTGTIDVRDNDSAGYNELIVGDQSITISGSFNYVTSEGSATQLLLIDAAFDVSRLSIEYAYEETLGYRKYTTSGYVTECTSTAADPETFSFTIAVDSKPTEGVQA